MNKIPIFFSFNNNYVIQASVAFETLLQNADANIFYKMFVLHTDINSKNQEILKQQIKSHNNAEILFINVSDYFQEIYFSDKKFANTAGGSIFTIETLYRCLAVEVPELNDIDKIIYSDVDICVQKDISKLFDIDIENKYLAACKTPKFLDFQIEHIPPEYQKYYFAGGLWVLNLKKMREDNLAQKIKNIILNPPFFLKYPDQDIMCLVCKDKVEYFSHSYISVPERLPLLKSLQFKDEYYPNNQLYDAAYNPIIIHYAGIKPWIQKCAGDELWFYWLSKTPFVNYKNKLKTQKKSDIHLYLFSFIKIPFIKAKKYNNKIKFYFCNIPILKISNYKD